MKNSGNRNIKTINLFTVNNMREIEITLNPEPEDGLLDIEVFKQSFRAELEKYLAAKDITYDVLTIDAYEIGANSYDAFKAWDDNESVRELSDEIRDVFYEIKAVAYADAYVREVASTE